VADHNDPVLWLDQADIIYCKGAFDGSVPYVSQRSAEEATRRAVEAARYDHVATQGQVAALNEHVAGLESALAAERARVRELVALLGEVFAWSVEHAPVVGGTRIVPWLDRYRAALSAGEK
jgi:hypothetical protein